MCEFKDEAVTTSCAKTYRYFADLPQVQLARSRTRRGRCSWSKSDLWLSFSAVPAFRDASCSHPLAPASASADSFAEKLHALKRVTSIADLFPAPPPNIRPHCFLRFTTATLYEVPCHCYASLSGRVTRDYVRTASSINNSVQEANPRRCGGARDRYQKLYDQGQSK